MQLNTTKALFLLFFCSIAGAMYWYSGTAGPLSQQEVDYYISEIEAQSQIPGGKHDLLALREFLETDDGKSFYTVNLYKFYDLAHYDANEQATGTGRRAFDRFSEAMIRLLARQASHPIFASNWIDQGASRWDRIVVVRYRSRRDIATIFANPIFADAAAHKWAGLRENERLLVQALHVPEFLLPLVLVLVTLISIGALATRKNNLSFLNTP